MQKEVGFKVGDMVKILKYSQEKDMRWDEITVGDIGKVLYITNEGNYELDNEFIYAAEELALATRKQPKPDNLSQAELQFLTKVLSVGLREYSSSIKDLKEDIDSLWNACDGTEGTTNVFNCLNAHKDDLKASKALYKKLSEIQRKLKKQAGK